ncbi:MAG: mobile mystery protein [Verrucomicrobia bacterium]|nr:mobile mystery protein [Verrucomicrobiota bacterium]
MSTDLFPAGEHETELSAEEQLDLIPSVSTRAQLNRVERLNINTARIWAMKSRTLQNPDLLTDHFGRELHRRMFNGIWRWAGHYRTTGKNLGWEVHRLNEGVRNAFDDSKAQLQHAVFSVPEVAVRLHHRLVTIHPWPNGNGRHARLMADIVVAAHGKAELPWGRKANLVEVGELRARYIAAIHCADAGDLKPLLDFAQH